MLHGPLHHGGPDGRCRECGEPFPCPTGLAIFEAVKAELDHPTSLPLESTLNVSGRAATADEAHLLEHARHFEAEQPLPPAPYPGRCDEPECDWYGKYWACAHGHAAGATWHRPLHWEDLEDRADRCPKCLHWWVSHGVPTEDGYGCSMPISSVDERERGIYAYCGCAFAEANPVTPRQVRIWADNTSEPTPPWAEIASRES